MPFVNILLKKLIERTFFVREEISVNVIKGSILSMDKPSLSLFIVQIPTGTCSLNWHDISAQVSLVQTYSSRGFELTYCLTKSVSILAAYKKLLSFNNGLNLPLTPTPYLSRYEMSSKTISNQP